MDIIVEDNNYVGNDSKQLHNESLKENVDKVGAISFSRSREMSDQIRLDLSTIIS